MDAHFLDEGQLLGLEIANVGEEEYTEEMQLEVIDVATWENKHGL